MRAIALLQLRLSTALLSCALGSALGWSGGAPGFEELAAAFLVTALNAPVYATLDVQDAAIVDAFLERIDAALALRARDGWGFDGWVQTDLDYYRLGSDDGPKVRCARIGLGPFGWRLFWTRLDRHVVVASRNSVLEELLQAPQPSAPDAEGHALLRLQPAAWNAVKADYELGWAENARRACLANLGPLANLLRAVPTAVRADPDQLRARLEALAHTFHGARFYCPDGGEYLASGERDCRCTVHGTLRAPVQLASPARDGEVGRMLRGFSGCTATLTFLPEGLRAVVEVEQR